MQTHFAHRCKTAMRSVFCALSHVRKNSVGLPCALASTPRAFSAAVRCCFRWMSPMPWSTTPLASVWRSQVGRSLCVSISFFQVWALGRLRLCCCSSAFVASSRDALSCVGCGIPSLSTCARECLPKRMFEVAMARAAVVALLALVGVVMRVDALADSLRVNKPLVPFKLEPLRWGSVRPRG